MRLVTFVGRHGKAPGTPRAGALVADGASVLDLEAAIAGRVEAVPNETPHGLLRWCDLDGPGVAEALAFCRTVATDASQRSALREQRILHPRDEVRLLSPVLRPGKLVAIGLNYRDHAKEARLPLPERPVVFSKFPTAVVGPDEPVVLPRSSSCVDYEAELAVVIGRRGKQIPAERALDYVLGYLNLNDVSARDFQFPDKQWQRGKSCDTFAPMGPFIAMSDEIPDPHRLRIRLRLNGETMQDSNTGELIFSVPELIAFVSDTITLEPGDVIATGTPSGVGYARTPPIYLKPGDVMEVEIDGLGVLSNPVVASDA